ncbi:hypothetical protein AB0C34_18995 [Nocardia sp. NPDC049220]|uniref:hypothetical protein n=1 Tax=Nocardia sp. NPDC049220 TaxID=3155273 RepID=UPI0033CFCFF8
MDQPGAAPRTGGGDQVRYLTLLLSNRMLLGIFFGQFFITAITGFFLTWFPVYLVQERAACPF